MTIRDQRIANHLAGIERPEDQGKKVAPPTAGEIVAYLRDVDAGELRGYMAHPRYGTAFKANVEAAHAEYQRLRSGNE